jgi:long-subunit fatty acid transport protein
MTFKTLASTTAILAVGASTAYAGALDRGKLPISPIFEKGTYVEVGTALILPSIDGRTAGGAKVSNIYDNYTQSQLSFKTDINDNLAVAFSFYQPAGTDITYATNPFLGPLSGTTATLNVSDISAIVKYRFDNNISIYGGARYETINATLTLGPTPPNAFSFARDYDIAPIAGIAYEKPDIALRVSFTYVGKTEYMLNTTIAGVGTVPRSATGVPESYTFNFQTGIAKDTLVFGEIRHSRWTGVDIIVPAIAPPIGPNLSNFDNITSFDLGIGRKLTDKLSVFTSLNYERRIDGITGNLAPIDGRRAISIGGSYKKGNAKFTGGVRYTQLGDVTTTTFGNSFKNNSSISLGFKVGYTF